MKWLLILCLLISGCSTQVQEAKPQSEDLHLVVASDLHYLSSQLYDSGERFQLMLENGDGKMVEYSEEVLDAFVDQMLEKHPDAVILSGDLTFNGERFSHQDLSKKLMRLKEAGIAVHLLPGNHDLNSTLGYQFTGNTSQKVEGISEEEFKDIYEMFYEGAISRDRDSLSYITSLREDLWLLMLDVNSEGVSNGFEESSWKWIEKQLEKAQKQGKKVISVTHQNAIVHNDAFTWGYIINNNGRLLDLFETYGIHLNLSGHLHIQHRVSYGNCTDLTTSSLSVSPNQYSEIMIDENQFLQMQSQPLRVSEWAEKKGLTDEKLLHFEAYSKDYFMKTNSKKLASRIDETSLSKEEKAAIKSFVSETNYSYFAGNSFSRFQELSTMLGHDFWLNCKEALSFDYYITWILSEEADHTTLEMQL